MCRKENASFHRATADELEAMWRWNVDSNPDDPRWKAWAEEYIAMNRDGRAVTFAAVVDGVPCGEVTLLLSPACRAVSGRTALCDGQHTANVNALRIRKPWEGRGHVSALMRVLEAEARARGITRLTIGVDAAEARNLAIYLHWGYRTFLLYEVEDGELVLYYAKDL